MPRTFVPQSQPGYVPPAHAPSTQQDDTDPPPAKRRATEARVPNFQPAQPLYELEAMTAAILRDAAPPAPRASSSKARKPAKRAASGSAGQPGVVSRKARAATRDQGVRVTGAVASDPRRGVSKEKEIEELLEKGSMTHAAMAKKLGVSRTVVHETGINLRHGGRKHWQDLVAEGRDGEVTALRAAGLDYATIIERTGIRYQSLRARCRREGLTGRPVPRTPHCPGVAPPPGHGVSGGSTTTTTTTTGTAGDPAPETPWVDTNLAFDGVDADLAEFGLSFLA